MKHLSFHYIVIMGVIALAALHDPIPVFGQTTIAIRGGLSRATIGGDDASLEGLDMGARTGIKVGTSATITIQDRFALQLSGNYVQKGWQADVVEDGFLDFFGIDNLSGSANLDYIEFSGLGIASLVPPGGPTSIYVLAGPAVAFNVKCGIVGTDGSTTGKPVDCGDFVKTRTVDLGITGGIGTEIAISEGMTFLVELLYTLGVQSFSKVENDDVKNRSIALQVGIGLPIGK